MAEAPFSERAQEAEDVPAEDVPAEDVPAEDVPAEDVPAEEHVYLLAPVGRDASLGRDVLAEAGLSCTGCAGASALPDGFAQAAGALVLTEEALTEPACAMLREALAGQPAWSDVPLVLLVDADRSRRERLNAERALRPSGNVTVIARPLRPPTLVSVVRSVLRDRGRQREGQRLLAQLERAKRRLEGRVDDYTADLRKRNRQVRSLAASLTAAEQKERERISQILHDEFQQLLYGHRLHIQALRNGVPPERETELLGQMDETTDEAIDLARSLASELNPPELDTEGFWAALHRLVDQMKERYGLTVDLQGSPLGPVLGRERRLLLFRLVRELLFNVAKHARVSRATLTTARRGDRLTVRVGDEGTGFDPERARDERDANSGFGLFAMQERLALFSGEMDLDTAPGEGTRVTLTLPAQAKDDDSLVAGNRSSIVDR